MKSLISTIQSNIKWKHHSYTIDNVFFRLHYRVTMCVLMIIVLMVSSQELIGEHIKCIGVTDKDVLKIVNRYCFFTTTFTVVKYMNSTMLDRADILYPGVGAHGKLEDEEVKYHAYYQWVPMVLFAQALLFYIPHKIWKKKEGQRIMKLIDGLEYASMAKDEFERPITILSKKVPTSKEVETQFGKIKKYLADSLIVNQNWTLWLIICEFMNLANLLLNIWLTNAFLNGHFLSLGPKLMREGLDSNVDPLDVVFPKMTKCIFYKYGPSGTLQPIDLVCVMALNIINEKAYAFLWFWFMIVLVLSIVNLIWRLVTMCFYSRSAWFNKIVFSLASSGRINVWKLMIVTRDYCYSDWLFMVYLAKNMNSLVFIKFLDGLAAEIQKSPEPVNYFDNLLDHDGGTTYTKENEKIHKDKLYPSYSDEFLINKSNSDLDTLLKKERESRYSKEEKASTVKMYPSDNDDQLNSNSESDLDNEPELEQQKPEEESPYATLKKRPVPAKRATAPPADNTTEKKE